MAVGAITGPMLAAENVRCEVPIQIARNDQVQTSIAIVVDETSSGAPAASSHSRLGRNIRKSPVAIVVVQSVPTEISDQQVRVSVIVVVPGRYSHAVSSALHPCGFRNVGKSAVVVVIEHGHTCSHRFGEIFLRCPAGFVLKADSGFRCYVGKHWQMSGLHPLRQGSVQGTRGESKAKKRPAIHVEGGAYGCSPRAGTVI